MIVPTLAVSFALLATLLANPATTLPAAPNPAEYKSSGVPSGLRVTTYPRTQCKGAPNTDTRDFIYGFHVHGDEERIWSVYVDRDMGPDEVLEWSTVPPGVAPGRSSQEKGTGRTRECDTILESQVGVKKGCYDGDKLKGYPYCVRVWKMNRDAKMPGGNVMPHTGGP